MEISINFIFFYFDGVPDGVSPWQEGDRRDTLPADRLSEHGRS